VCVCLCVCVCVCGYVRVCVCMCMCVRPIYFVKFRWLMEFVKCRWNITHALQILYALRLWRLDDVLSLRCAHLRTWWNSDVYIYIISKDINIYNRLPCKSLLETVRMHRDDWICDFRYLIEFVECIIIIKFVILHNFLSSCNFVTTVKQCKPL